VVEGFPRNNRRDCDCRRTHDRGQDGRIPHDHIKWDQGGVQHMDIGQEAQRDVRGTYIGCWASAMLNTRPNLVDDCRCSFDYC